MKRIGLAVLVALLIAIVAWFALQSNDEPTAARAASSEDTRPARDEAPAIRSETSDQALARAAAEVDADIVAPATAETAPPDLTVRGKVVDDRRFAVEGAQVTLQLVSGSERTTRTARSKSDGSVAFEFAERPSGNGGEAEAWAQLGGTSAGLTVNWIPGTKPSRTASGFRVPSASPHEFDLGSIVLLPASSLHVVVRDANQPASRAHVDVELMPRFNYALSFEADARGELDLPPLPESRLRLRATLDGKEGRVSAFVPHDSNLVIDLAPSRQVALVVVDAASGAPVAGAAIKVNELFPVPAPTTSDPERRSLNSESWMERALDDLKVVTDSDGRAQLRVPNGVRPRLSASAAGYHDFPEGNQEEPELSSEVAEQRIEMRSINARVVRWPINAGEVPPPPDGASVKILPAPGMRVVGEDPTMPPPGHMEGTTLVVSDVSSWAYLGEAEDGSLAMLAISDKPGEGKPATFRRARRIEVLVRNATGKPVEGAAASARNQGNNALCGWTTADSDGRAWLTRLYGGLAEVYVAMPGDGGIGTNAGTVDLEKGDGRVEFVLPTHASALVRTVIDDQPRLPAKLSIWSAPQCRIVDEMPEQGVVRIDLVAQPGERRQCSLSALGFLTARFEALAGERGSETIVDVPLQRAGTLIADVMLPSDGHVSLVGERWDEKQNAWAAPTGTSGHSLPNGPNGTFVFPGCEPGRWRARDSHSNVASNEIELAPGALEGRVVLDLASIQWVTGRVEVPPGGSSSGVIVTVEGGDAQPRTFDRLTDGSMPDGEPVYKDGAFRVRVPGDREVTVRPWHAWLVPAREGGSLTTRSGRDGVVLRLEQGDEIRLPVPQIAALRNMEFGGPSLRIAVFRGHVEGEPLRWLYAPLVDGVARFGGLEPGTWTLWIDPRREFMPLVLEGVEVKAGINELATAHFDPGSSIRVRVQVAEGQAPPRTYLSARSAQSPAYYRSGNATSKGELVVAGFGPGRFEVTLRRIMLDGKGEEPRTIELDGKTEFVLDLDLSH